MEKPEAMFYLETVQPYTADPEGVVWLYLLRGHFHRTKWLLYPIPGAGLSKAGHLYSRGEVGSEQQMTQTCLHGHLETHFLNYSIIVV